MTAFKLEAWPILHRCHVTLPLHNLFIFQNMKLMRAAPHISLLLFKESGHRFPQNKQTSRTAAHDCKRGGGDSCERLRTSLFQPRSVVLEIIWPRAVSLSPYNLIGKPEARHGVPAAHIWANILSVNDTNLWVRWQSGDERGGGGIHRAVADTRPDVHIAVRLQVTPGGGFTPHRFMPESSWMCSITWYLYCFNTRDPDWCTSYWKIKFLTLILIYSYLFLFSVSKIRIL